MPLFCHMSRAHLTETYLNTATTQLRNTLLVLVSFDVTRVARHPRDGPWSRLEQGWRRRGELRRLGRLRWLGAWSGLRPRCLRVCQLGRDPRPRSLLLRARNL